jgi:hypothetical protein
MLAACICSVVQVLMAPLVLCAYQRVLVSLPKVATCSFLQAVLLVLAEA